MKNLITMSLFMAVSSFAAQPTMYCKTELKDYKTCKNIPENRRKELGKQVAGGNPVAVTKESGELKVWYTVGDSPDLQGCTVTTNVGEFKMSANPNDLATLYFEKNGEMYDLKMSGSVSRGYCPEAKKQNYTENLNGKVIDIAVIPDSNSTLVAIGLTENGYVIYSYDKSIDRKFFGDDAKAEFKKLLK